MREIRKLQNRWQIQLDVMNKNSLSLRDVILVKNTHNIPWLARVDLSVLKNTQCWHIMKYLNHILWPCGLTQSSIHFKVGE